MIGSIPTERSAEAPETSILFRQMALIMTSKARDHTDPANFACGLALIIANRPIRDPGGIMNRLATRELN